MAATYQTLADVFSDVRFISSKDSTTLPDSNLLRLANKYYLLLVRELVDLNEEYYGEISYTNLISGQREYVLPIDDTTGSSSRGVYGGGFVKMNRVEVNYTGNASDWRLSDPISVQQIPTTTIADADLNAQYSKNDPKYWFFDRSVWLAPVPDAAVSNGLYMYWIKRVNEMTATTDIPDFPKDFLSVLTEGILSDVFRRYGRINDALKAQSNWEAGLANMREKEQAPDVEQKPGFRVMPKNYK